jgi:hypothetical protein
VQLRTIGFIPEALAGSDDGELGVEKPVLRPYHASLVWSRRHDFKSSGRSCSTTVNDTRRYFAVVFFDSQLLNLFLFQ